jgi:hypothetical protein
MLFARTSPEPLAVLACSLVALAQLVDVAYAADSPASGPSLTVAIEAHGDSQSAPHGKGNVYAPDVHFDASRYRMWFGGQGRDGHDRIHLAESPDGVQWESRGVVLEDPTANHVNDPSVVRRGDIWFMYYTRAASDVLDEIALATSRDGVHWQPRGIVLRPTAPPHWDSLLVGRPSVLLDNGTFRMWYDGRRDLPPGAPAKDAPKAAASSRSVGYAESSDGVHWRRPQPEPVFTGNAGGVHVVRTTSGFAMVYESHAGTQLATSPDGLHWKPQETLAPATGTPADRFGHVTPFLFLDPRDRRYSLFIGAARGATWDQNTVARLPLTDEQHSQLKATRPAKRESAAAFD